jgi:hypothetical protein
MKPIDIAILAASLALVALLAIKGAGQEKPVAAECLGAPEECAWDRDTTEGPEWRGRQPGAGAAWKRLGITGR